MSVISPDQRAGYKLVPLLNSEESELSEEELESFYRDGFQIITRKNVRSSDYHKLDADLNFSKKSKICTMNTENFDLKAKNIFPTVRENVSYELTSMSKERKISLVLSILLCICTVVVFIILPCDWNNCSCLQNEEKSVEIWTFVFSDKELKGDINLVGNVLEKHHNLLFIACGSILMDSPVIRSDLTSPMGGDLLLLDGLNGKQIWRKHFNRIPVEVDCSIMQPKNRTLDKCVLLSEKNFVTLISSHEGKILWSFSGNVKYNRDYYQFPVVLPDLDGDGVRELALIKDLNKLVLLSGSSGTVLSNNITNGKCKEISQLKYTERLNLSYLCELKNDTSLKVNVSLERERYLIIDPATKKNARIPQHISRNSNESIIKGHRMIVRNEGTFCPNNCTSKIDIINHKNKTVWSHESLDTYVMKPVAFSFNDSGIFGFVFKIWEHEYEGDEVKKLKINKHSYQYSVGYISERTVIVVFNSVIGEPLHINMSLNPILQLQVSNDTLQPNPKNQDNSLLVLDVNKNGTYQLVTYYSTFEEMKKNYFMDATTTKSHFMLKSYIHMYDLKKEINEKLFDSTA